MHLSKQIKLNWETYFINEHFKLCQNRKKRKGKSEGERNSSDKRKTCRLLYMLIKRE